MDKPMPNLGFKLMSLLFKVRDFLRPREDVLKEAEIKPGFHVLDYGCGPGSYSFVVSELVGDAGKAYALDIHPLALQRIQKVVSERNISNIETIESDCATGLEDESIDVVLLNDIFHDLTEPDKVLQELARVLKKEGILSFTDHHMKENEILSHVTAGGLFILSKNGEKTYSFVKKVPAASADR